MGAAIEVFEGSRLIEVGRDRFVPVKTTNDLLVLRSDVYDIGHDFVLDQEAEQVPYVDLDATYYKLVGEFDKRFPEGAPSLKQAQRLTSRATGPSATASRWSATCRVGGRSAQRVDPGAVLSGDPDA